MDGVQARVRGAERRELFIAPAFYIYIKVHLKTDIQQPALRETGITHVST